MNKKFVNIDLTILDEIINNSPLFEDQKLTSVIDFLCEKHKQRIIGRLHLGTEKMKNDSVTIEIDKVKITFNN